MKKLNATTGETEKNIIQRGLKFLKSFNCRFSQALSNFEFLLHRLIGC